MDTSRIRSVVAAAGALLAVFALAGGNQAEPFALVAMDEVERMVGKPDVFIVDANPEDVFRKNHLPGAQWYRSKPFAQLLPAQKDQRLVFYCANPH
jgi:rhodanese-related sulfurtransferase